MFGGGSTLGPANVYTYRTPDYMLSSTQNYKSKSSLYLHNSKDFIFQYRFLFSVGWMVGQQHDWQATLDENREGTFFSHQPTTTTADEVVSFL